MWRAELGPDAVARLAFAPGGRHLLAADAGGRLVAFDAATQGRTDLNPALVWPVRDFALTPDGSTLLLIEGAHGLVGGYRLAAHPVAAPPGGELSLGQAFGERRFPYRVGRVLLAAGGAEAYLPVEAQQGRRRPLDTAPAAYRQAVGAGPGGPLELPPPLRGERPAAASPGGTLMAWPARETDRVTVWDTVKDWRRRTVVLDPPGTAIALSDAGCVAALPPAYRYVRLYHPGVRLPVCLWLHAPYDMTGFPIEAAFSAASDLIATYNVGESVEIWHADTGALLGRYDWLVGRVTAAAFAPDGLTLAVGGESGGVAVFDVGA